MSKWSLVFICVFALYLGDVCRCDSTEDVVEHEKEVDVADDVVLNGYHFRRFLDTDHLDPKLREYLVADAREILGAIMGTIGPQLAQNKNPGFMGKLTWVGLGTNLMKLGMSQRARRRKLNKSPKNKGLFNKAMAKMFDGMLVESKVHEAEAKSQPKDYLGLKKDLEQYIDSLLETLEASPYGPYLDFTTATVDGKAWTEVTARLMGRLRHHGYAMIFDGIKGLMDFIAGGSN